MKKALKVGFAVSSFFVSNAFAVDLIGKDNPYLELRLTLLTKKLSFLAKSAFYNGKDGYYTGGSLKATKDINKYWIQLDYKY